MAVFQETAAARSHLSSEPLVFAGHRWLFSAYFGSCSSSYQIHIVVFFFFPWLFLNSLELLTLKPSPYINLTAWPLCSHVNASYCCRVENISVTQTQAMQMTTQSHLCSVSVSARCCSACLPLFARNKGGRREVDYKGPSRGREERGGVTGGLMLFGWHVRYVFSSLVDGCQSQSPPEQRVFSSVKLSRRRL